MTREEAAREMSERNGRCGHVNNERICLRAKNHTGEHVFEPIEKVIPFVNP